MRRLGYRLFAAAVVLSLAIWIFSDDLPFDALVALLAVSVFPTAGVLVGAGHAKRLVAIPLGVLLGAIAAIALVVSLTLASEKWAELALHSVISYGQGHASNLLAVPGAGCPLAETIMPGTFTVLHRDRFFGAWEFDVLLPGTQKRFFSLRRIGREWSCSVGPSAR